MTKNIFRKIALLAGVALMGVGCQTDYFNENYLPGYDNNGDITNVQEMEITLSEDDYAAIAKNSANKAIAEAAGEEAVAALSAISKNKYFASQDEAATYVPGWLAAGYPTYDNGSLALITYTMALDIPHDVQAMNAATEYTLTEDDYKTIWGSEEDYAAALTPKTVNKLRTVIPVADDAREGEYVVVTYNYSAEEPATEEPETPENPDQPEGPKYSSVLGSAGLDDAVEVKGYVSALSTQGPIITDATGSILLFKGADLAIGDEVTVSGTISAYNKGFQIAASSATVEKTGTTSVTYPTPVELDGAAMEALLTSRTDNDYAQFVKFTGTPSISDKGYINIIMEGTEAAQGSIYGATDEVKAMFTEGQEATIYGYFVSISSGKYINVVVVSVDEEPAIGGGEETNSYSSVLGSAVLGDFVEVNGYISAVSTQGPILTDNGGSLLLFKTSGYEVGDVVSVSGTISSYGKGFQIGTADITIEKIGTTTVTYPAPMEITGAMADELLTTRVNDEYAYYAKMTGTVAINGNYYNFILPGATTAQGSFYGATDELKVQLADGMECTIYGYFTSLSGGKYINMVVTSIETAPTATALALKVKSEKRYAYFKFNGTAYEATDIVAVQPSDYTSMGQGYGNFTNPTQDNYLPQFLAQKYPYAQVDDKLYVGFRCYAGGATSWKVDEYVFNGEWTKTIYFADKTDQFRKVEGIWEIDRTLELDYTNTSGADTKAFYQYCVNWVYDFKDVPMGAPARDNAGEIISTEKVMINGALPAGNYWVSNYGNNEFYTGASAYFGNMDWRPSAVKGGFAAAGMGDLTDDEILAKLKENSAEVFAEVLGYMYPEVTIDDYKKIVVKVYCYGPNKNYSFTFDVVEQGKFQYAADSLTEL
ncbi:MAG: OB-fold nucleic acid binding domain-containing protein [Alistipes sp.]|nr:OB-fold nucleic acid binding domain-containing protein [Alistipes sp.]